MDSPIVNASSRSGQNRLIRFDASLTTSTVLLEVVARESALQQRSRVHHIDGLLDGNVAPVRHLDDALQPGDGQEWIVVLEVDGNFGGGEFCIMKLIIKYKKADFKKISFLFTGNIVVRTIGQDGLRLAGRFDRREALHILRAQMDGRLLGEGHVWTVEMGASKVPNQLLFILHNLGGESVHRIRERCLDVQDLCGSSSASGQSHRKRGAFLAGRLLVLELLLGRVPDDDVRQRIALLLGHNEVVGADHLLVLVGQSDLVDYLDVLRGEVNGAVHIAILDSSIHG